VETAPKRYERNRERRRQVWSNATGEKEVAKNTLRKRSMTSGRTGEAGGKKAKHKAKRLPPDLSFWQLGEGKETGAFTDTKSFTRGRKAGKRAYVATKVNRE